MEHLTPDKIRITEKLVKDMECLFPYLQDDDITEIMLNPNSELWVDSLSHGSLSVASIDSRKAQTIIYSLAGLMGRIITPEDPFLEIDLPNDMGLQGERISALMPPVVSKPTFTIRKRSKHLFSLNDYVKSKRLSTENAVIIKSWLRERKNILVAGSPGSGKTTVTNSLIHEVCQENPNERFIILEDVPELKCSGKNQVPCLTSPHVSLGRLLISATRSKPSRILVGEVRSKEAYDMLLAWNIGCLGGIGTIHANGVRAALRRIIDLCYLAGHLTPPIDLICETVHAIIFVERRGTQSGFITDMALVNGYRNGEFDLLTMNQNESEREESCSSD